MDSHHRWRGIAGYGSYIVKTALLRNIVVLFVLAGSLLPARAQRNEILNDRIASLQVTAGDDWLEMPVVALGGQTGITIAFDDLTHEYHRYCYKIEHCEADWTVSEDLFASDFVEGFAEGTVIDELDESVNTEVLYTHYSFTLPNSQCRIKMSGNYRVTVYDENNDDEVMFTACFMVVEPLMGVSAGITTNTDLTIHQRHQQLEMQVNYNTLRVTDPQEQIKTVVLQNGRWDNARVNVRPQYVMGDGLRWAHCRDYIFEGGNEYRKFEILDVHHTTLGIESIHWDGDRYHAYVFTDEPRPNYLYDEDADGAFCIRNSDNVDSDILSDYMWVHFRLQAPRQQGDVYLNGAWTNDRFLPAYRMTYDEAEGCYTNTLLLKLGYYSYQYLVMAQDGTLRPVTTEGSFYQTENSYQVLVYYRGTGERTDRLVGYCKISS